LQQIQGGEIHYWQRAEGPEQKTLAGGKAKTICAVGTGAGVEGRTALEKGKEQ